MRVLHVIPGVAPRYGGPSVAVVAMCRALARRGVECFIATTDADGEQRLEVPLGEATTYDGVPAIFFRREWSEAYKVSRPLARWLEAHVADFDLVEIHAIFSHSSLAAGRACRSRGVPYVVRPLGSLAPWSLARKAWRKRVLWRLGVARLLQDAAAIHYTSTAEQQQAESALELPRGAVVPLPVEISTSPTRTPSPWGDSPYVLVLSRLHEKKGLDLLIEAFADVTAAPSLLHWRLVLAGEGEAAWVEKLRCLASARARERILFPGWIGGEAKRAALEAAALLALPSRQENFALAAAEALACGVPVLLSQEVDLAATLAAAGAAWVASLDRNAIAAELAEALSDESERRRRGERGREWVRRNLSPEAVGEQLLAFYLRLTETTPRSDR